MRINSGMNRVLALSALLLIAPTAAAQATEEEQLVRLAYMKLMFYHQVGLGNRFEMEKKAPQPDDLLRFRIRDMKTGMIDEIIDRPYGELVTRGLGDIVQTAPAITWYRDGGQQYVYYMAHWETGHYTSMEDWQKTTLREVLRVTGHEMGDIYKYTSYEVRVRLLGKERTYRALALFPRRPLLTDPPRPVILDMITSGGTMMTNVLEETRPPIHARLAQADDPMGVVRNGQSRDAAAEEKEITPYLQMSLKVSNPEELRGGWLDEVETERPRNVRGRNFTRIGGCGIGESLCCDQMSGQCCWNAGYLWNPGYYTTCRYESGGGGGDGGGGGGGGGSVPPPSCLQVEVLGPPRYGPGPDDQYHLTGYHEITGKLTPVCRYYSSCVTDCSHLVDGVGGRDTGLVYTSVSHSVSYHYLNPKVGTANGLSQTPTCKAAIAGGARTCFFGSCGLTIAIDLEALKFQITEATIWTYMNPSEWTCAPATRVN